MAAQAASVGGFLELIPGKLTESTSGVRIRLGTKLSVEVERGCFILPERCPGDGHIEHRDLVMLLEGIVPKKVGKRYIKT